MGNNASEICKRQPISTGTVQALVFFLPTSHLQHDIHFRFSFLCSHIAMIKALISQGHITKFQGGISMTNVLMKKVCSVPVIWVLAF